jgi:uncharacterized membrane protein
VLFLNISATNVRETTPCLSAYKIFLRFLSHVGAFLGRLLRRSFALIMPSDDALKEFRTSVCPPTKGNLEIV